MEKKEKKIAIITAVHGTKMWKLKIEENHVEVAFIVIILSQKRKITRQEQKAQAKKESALKTKKKQANLT